MADDSGSISGLNAEQAKEFHAQFMLGFIVFTVIAIIAHFLVWQWRPWLPGPEGYTSLIDSGSAVYHTITSWIS